MLVWIELPSDFGWGMTQRLKHTLSQQHYHVEEFRGTPPSMLLITGAPVDRAGGLTPPRGRQDLPAEPVATAARTEPMLAAHPDDAPCAGRPMPVGQAVTMRMRDGSWVWARVTWQCRDRTGRWWVRVRWPGEPGRPQREAWLAYDRTHLQQL